MKHKNYEWIVAFAEGKEVQYYIDIYDDRMTGKPDWHTVNALPIFELESVKFRIKPEVKKTVGYRQFYEYGVDGVTIHLHTLQADSVISPAAVESLPRLIGWKHKEWQYDDVEAN